jgi:cytochrome c-type biogenesis protein CcmF
MSTLGTYTLLAAFVACAYAAAAAVAGHRRHAPRLVESGIGAFYLVTALMTLASAIIVRAFVIGDYSIRYVDRYSDSIQPLFYRLTSYWGGLDGSIMFWVFLLSVFGAIAVRTNRERHRELLPYVIATIAVVQMFFLSIMIVSKDPFATYLTQMPDDGRGLNPLLQNPYMVIHPPSLYTGLVAMTVPFAFGIAALITGYLDDSWLRAVRRWTMFSWFFLSLGLTLGMIWAYEELGWGGWWGWDPVENAGALPWFPATAFLHSVMVQERRSMLRVWNISLIIIAFALTLFATAMTRTGIVQSVHAFGEDPQLAMMFGIFISAVVIVSFGLVIYRLPLLRARNELESWASREAAFLANNWILLFSAFFILFATMFPTLSEAVTGQRITVGPPFFNKWMIPIGLMLLLLTGIGPLLAWRKSTLSNLLYQFVWPAVVAVTTAAVLYALGFRVWVSGICFALCGFVVGTVGQEFVRGAIVRRGVTGTDLLTAMIGLVMRSRRRYGGYVVHLGIVLMMLGFAGSGYRQTEQVLLGTGEQVEVGRFSVRHDRLSVTDDGAKEMHTAHVTVFENGREVGQLYPGRWYYRKHETEPTTEVAMRRRLSEDVYVVLAAYDVSDQSATFQVTVNPLVNWIWFGFALLALGTGIALLPESRFAFLASSAPDRDVGAASGVTTTVLVLALALPGLAAPASAQVGAAPESYAATTPLEADLQRRLVCTCGDCPHYTLADCRCSSPPRYVTAADGSQQLVSAGAEFMRGQLREQIEAGRDQREILDYFIAAYGSQEPLGAPLDEGFNRLAWLFPYLVGLGCLVGVGGVAVRWSRRGTVAAIEAAPAPETIDAELDARLDDELRNLD